MSVVDPLGHQDDNWTKSPQHAFLVASVFAERSRAMDLIRSGKRLTNREIARRSKTVEAVVQKLRWINVGAVPNASHDDITWLFYGYAWHYKLDCHREQGIALGNRKRAIPDLVICESPEGPVLWVVEVKTTIAGRKALRIAVDQVLRYREIIGEGTPVVVCYRPPVHDVEVDGVQIWTLSRLRREMKLAGERIAACATSEEAA